MDSPRLHARFFAAAVRDGQLFVRGMFPGSAWDRNRLEYRTEEEIDALKNRTDDRKTRSIGELRECMNGLSSGSPALWIWLWIHEDLEDEVRLLWQLGRVA